MKEVQRELRLLSRRQRLQERIPPQLETASKVLLCRLSGSVVPLLEFLTQRSNRPQHTLAAWSAKLEAWFLKAGLDERR